ncbi:MAG TPA: lysophospholipid acyltransferase family protein [Thermoanaerobaculia bacterium]|nr:lysophospholipid acyltransferase family protein [Thermoanaerobaculia bacterium]
MSVLWLPVNLLQIAVVSLWSAGCIVVAILASKVARSPRPGLWLARRVWAPVTLACAGARLEAIQGRKRIDPSRAYFVVANHQSWLDIPVLFAVLPVPVLFIGKQELTRIPFLKHYMEAMGMVFVKRADRRDSLRSVAAITARLRDGWSVLSFPEGTRSVDGRLQRFHAATFAAALDAGVPVLPIALEGTARIMPRQSIGFRPGRVNVAFGEPISTEGVSRDDRAALSVRAQQAVAAELARLRAHGGVIPKCS